MSETLPVFALEIWFEILSTKSELSYFDYKRLLRVNKALNALLSTSYFDSVFFRDSPLDKHTLLVPPKLHPLIGYECVDPVTSSIKELTLLNWDNEKHYRSDKRNVLDFAAAKEHATSPAVTALKFSFTYGGPSATVRNKDGVTVEQVLRSCVEYCNSKSYGVPLFAEKELMEGYGLKSRKELKLIHTLGDHRFFEGWEVGKITEGGSLYLGAMLGS